MKTVFQLRREERERQEEEDRLTEAKRMAEMLAAWYGEIQKICKDMGREVPPMTDFRTSKHAEQYMYQLREERRQHQQDRWAENARAEERTEAQRAFRKKVRRARGEKRLREKKPPWATRS